MSRIDGRGDQRWTSVLAVSGTAAPGVADRSGLSKGISLYIDLLRLVAALLVFIGHADTLLFNSQIPGLVSHHAREAVAIFFVLSGFVISFAANTRERSWTKYLVARASRIYPVAIISLITTLLCDIIGYRFDASLYDQLHYFSPESLAAALSYLTFTNQLWFSHTVFGTNEPYWSLAFEVWYYILFACFTFTGGIARLVIVLAGSVICGPIIVSYLPLWLLGSFLYVLYTKGLRLRSFAPIIFPLSIVVYQLTRRHLGFEPDNIFYILGPTKTLYNLAYYCLIGVITCINILSGGDVMERLLPYATTVAKGVRWAAGASFTLYLVHLPILIMLRAVFPSTSSSVPLACVACLTTLGVVLLLAELGERRKKDVAGVLTRLVNSAHPGAAR